MAYGDKNNYWRPKCMQFTYIIVHTSSLPTPRATLCIHLESEDGSQQCRYAISADYNHKPVNKHIRCDDLKLKFRDLMIILKNC
eukprot:2409474-Pleurochrysis_carterae.AAC.2